MTAQHDNNPVFDDNTIDAITTGENIPPELEALSHYIHLLRETAIQPVKPTPELARRMSTADFPTFQEAPDPTKRPGRWPAMSRQAQTIVAAVTALIVATAATAAGALPSGVQERVEKVIESITPIEFSSPIEPDNAPVVRDQSRDVTVDDTDTAQTDKAGLDASDHGTHKTYKANDSNDRTSNDRRPDNPLDHGNGDEHRPVDPPIDYPGDVPDVPGTPPPHGSPPVDR